jgi:DUF4097 and DUF4098 domain-containing protein YvlB
MKRTTLTILILAAALFTVAGDHKTAAQRGTSRTDPISNVLDNFSEPQTAGPELSEEFHQTYPLPPTGLVSIENVNGGVHISVWDQNQVKVDAVKRAYQRESLDEAKIEVTTTADSVRIRTTYPERDETSSDRSSRRHNSWASVEYSLTIPRQARLDSAGLVNGSLEIDGVEGEVKAACVNGDIKVRGLTGEVKLSTVNGSVEASVTKLDESKPVSLNSVNGSLVLTIPAEANAQIKANTVHGRITNDFGLPVNDGEYVGHSLKGQIGTGGPIIRLSNVNGPITIKRP